MGYEHARISNRLKAGALLRDLRARIVGDRGCQLSSVTSEAENGSPYWRLSNATGVHVYQTGEGWIADIVFKGMPLGVGDVLGTAVPTPSRREAIECAVALLAACAERDRVHPPDAANQILHFSFDDCGIPVHSGMVLRYVDRVRQAGDTRESIQDWLAELRYSATGDEPLQPSHYETIPPELRREFVKACTAAMAVGMTRFGMDDAVHAPGPRH